MLALAPAALPAKSAMAVPAVHAATGTRRGRVAILTGCAQSVLDPGINEAAIRLLTRLGIEVVVPRGETCCGSLVHHMGREEAALEAARRNVDVWIREIETGGLDAIIVTASGCGTTIKDYGFMLRLDPAYAGKAARISALARDVTEYLATIELPEPTVRPGLAVAYHSACSMQHGQKITRQPKELLAKAGFSVKEPREGHLCCGSAGTYNIMQPEIATELRDRKVKNIAATGADVVATGNIGCITQIAGRAGMPIVHTVELLDWAYGGPQAERALTEQKQKGQRCHCGALPSAVVRSTPSDAPGAPRRSHDDHLGADLDALEQVDHVLVAHADAARRDVGADGPWRVGAVNAIERAAEIERARAERVGRPAGHHDRQDAALLALAHDHLGRRPPFRPRRLAGDLFDAAPAKTFLADADAVAPRLAVGHHQIEKLVAAIDDDGARLFGAAIGDLLRQEFRVEAPLHLPLGVHRPHRRGLDACRAGRAAA